MDRLVISGLIGERRESLESILKEHGIGENFTASMLRDFLAQNPTGDIEVEIKTIGGDVIEGFEIYDALKREKAKGRTVKTFGKQFDSIGSIIFLAGSEGHRYAFKGASPLIHLAWNKPEDLGDLTLNSQTLQALADSHQEADEQMLFEYLKVAGYERKAELQELMRNDAQLTDNQLLDFNFANEIISETAAIKASPLRGLALNSLATQSPEQYADAVVMKDGKVFLIQRALDDDFEPGTWAFPGGKIEEGEAPDLAVVRELQEETGLSATYQEPLAVEANEDGSTSHYYAVLVDGEIELEQEEIAQSGWFDLAELPENIIKGQKDRYKSLIQKSIEMSEKLAALEKRLTALGAKLGLVTPKAMLLPLEGGDTELFIYSEDGEIEGKKAVVAEGGEPTETPAPEGTHTLNDGRQITVGAEGIIQSVSEAASAMENEEEMQAAKEKLEAANKDLQAAKDELKALKEAQAKKDAETSEALNALKQELDEIKEEIPGDRDKDENPMARLAALRKTKEEMDKLTPSQRRVAALKLEARKPNK